MSDPNSSKKKKSTNEEELTPWQKEHLRYLRERQDNEEKASDDKAEKSLESSETKQAENFSEEKIEEPPKKERISFADRLPKLKSYRNKQLHKRLLTIIMIFAIPLLFVLYYISPLNSLAEVDVSGNQNIASQKIVASSGLQVNQNLWRQYFDRDQFTRRLTKEFPRIKNAKIKFSALNQFRIDVTEHKEVSLLAKDGKYFPVLENGEVVQEPQEEADKDKIILEDFTNQNQILTTIENYRKLPQEIQSGVSQINYTPSDNNDELLTIFMNDGNRVIINVSNMDQQMQYYPQVAKEMDDKGIIDMEVGIFVRPYDENNTDDEEDQEDSE
ncbi:cell division protein FtsQ/DivIB [Tetragenococcus koreensis]|uniref:Cell division protein DivIB n=1 Tax=Tetragenococcus koreensis TaxID=290335 RepID=A0AAN4ZSR9_9ENTE|nr:FtsQ-type POTRA domain-containing protein [Tetragenococcus koreensis]MCF1616589.1 FtsQ-type POTRA domain-containing protein [Tetragenococcus koreensis]MCF1621462.1 FtsQ-type POTRA domain-containing protein [Tetragenococcus koreensis]MCF1625928.1 FtsQ-type POTRA domain-containing protein [Tetragenococcus koreensis]MCF1631343.1 FtsQ-type POTRA domain-containing protein [Tetragenococcus koreensis]MCF1677201.1 FtsQ-type POTRA domain-containing protein [Tetragenococcus koreensis]